MVVSYPNQITNYCIFSPETNLRVKRGDVELPSIKASLENPKSEDEVIEDLYILNCMIDSGTQPEKIAEIYPLLSKYNNTNSPNIQTYLAGIYRKTKIPDAFGPLVSMLIRNSINPPKDCHFDPNEEIGGAILDYLA